MIDAGVHAQLISQSMEGSCRPIAKVRPTKAYGCFAAIAVLCSSDLDARKLSFNILRAGRIRGVVVPSPLAPQRALGLGRQSPAVVIELLSTAYSTSMGMPRSSLRNLVPARRWCAYYQVILTGMAGAIMWRVLSGRVAVNGCAMPADTAIA